VPTPIAPRIILSQTARTDLHTVIRAPSTPQSLGLRARIVLKAADVDQPTNLTISRHVGCDNRTAGKWRRRYAALGLPGLQDAVRAGRPKTIAAPTRVHVLSGASTLPQDQERTVTRWT
jgi:transposase